MYDDPNLGRSVATSPTDAAWVSPPFDPGAGGAVGLPDTGIGAGGSELSDCTFDGIEPYGSVFFEDQGYLADFSVSVADQSYLADLDVFLVDQSYLASDCGKWHATDQSYLADFSVSIADGYLADITIHFVDQSYLAGAR